MDSRIALLAAVRQPFTTGDAAALGVDRHTMADLARAGAFHRVDRGAYVTAAVWRNASRERRHLLRCRAVLRRYGTVALSHTSAVVAHGRPTYGVDLGEVHLTRTKPGPMGRVATVFAVRVHPPLPIDAFLLPSGVIVEFDGAVKYEGASGRAALLREKRREDALRTAGREVVRLTWPDRDPPSTCTRRSTWRPRGRAKGSDDGHAWRSTDMRAVDRHPSWSTDRRPW